MTCTYDREQLALYVNRDSTAEEHSATEEHLSMCAECRTIVGQYQSTSSELVGTLAEVRPVRRPGGRTAHRPWRAVAAATAMVLALAGAMQVPVLAAQVAKAFPFLQVIELDRHGVAEFIRRFNRDHERPVKIYRPDVYQTLAEAEQAWGGTIPQPTALPAGMERSQIVMYRWESGHKDLYLHYGNPKGLAALHNLTIHISTRPLGTTVPHGATSETTVNGQKALVINGTWGQYPGKPLQWEPESDMHVYFPLGDLYGDVYTAGPHPGTAVSDLVKVAESIR